MRIVFFGTPFFAVPSLVALLQSQEKIIAVVTQPDKQKGRGRVLSPPPVKEIALRQGTRVLQPKSLKDPSFLDELYTLKPDMIIVVAYGKILPPQVLGLPPHGCINVHASLLPKYRGAAPIQWAIIQGEKETGITTMMMDEGLDTGNILLQEKTVIYDDDNSETLGKRLADIGGSLLIRTIDKIKEGSVTPAPQTGTSNYARPLKKEDGRIDWSNAATDLYNFVRGMYPWPCAYCYLNQERIKITRAIAVEGHGIAGRIEKADEELLVGTGEGFLSLTELQPEGKRLMTAKDFLMGRRLKKGIFFDGP
jgi:methionyl-tRNA formyltransferase